MVEVLDKIEEKAEEKAEEKTEAKTTTFGKFGLSNLFGDSAPKDDWMYYIAGLALFFYSISRWPISFAFAQVKLNQLIKISFIELLFKFLFTLLLFKYFSFVSPLIGMIVIHIMYVARGYQKIQ